MESIQLTSELSDLIKSFRIRNEKSAKDICTIIGKTPSYLSKIESNSTKKIDVSVFAEFCNAVRNSSEGIKDFIQFAYKNEAEYSKDTFLSLTNIDDVFYTFMPKNELLEYIKSEMSLHDISISDLVNELNCNNDLSNIDSSIYNALPENIYAFVDDEKNHLVIKLKYTDDVISNILNGTRETNHVTLEAILYTLFKLSGEQPDKARIKAIKTLENRFKIASARKTRKISINSKEDEEKYFGKLEPIVEDNYHSVIQCIRIALLLSQSKGGSERIDIMKKNLEADLGFSFSFISTDLKKILPLSKELKKEFLKDLNKLIDDYSGKIDKNVDFFFDD